ncbi:MAG: thermonuclease family protein [Candidatus Kapabacteria bacterium]|nr:thermonuclease family protein [Candidatus Kapabacteria bacterium]
MARPGAGHPLGKVLIIACTAPAVPAVLIAQSWPDRLAIAGLGAALALLWCHGLILRRRWIVIAGGDKPATDPVIISGLISLYALWGGSLSEPAGSYTASARALDGDTLALADGRRVRLWGIDAPELSQPYGIAARECLASLARGPITISPTSRDVYGRAIARVMAGDVDVSRALVARGCAWATAAEYAPLQARAAAERIGLWALPAPVPPWVWRSR